MKLTKLITVIALVTGTATLTAAEGTNDRKQRREMKSEETKRPSKNVQTHYGLGTSVLPINGHYVVTPLINWGVRAIENGAGIDVSASFSGNVNQHDDWMIAYQAPKLLYLTYVTPKEPTSLYYGLGGSWGGIHSKDSNFYGILANAAMGYELNRSKNLRSTIHMEMGYPILPFVESGNGKKPIIELAYNLSF